MNQELPSATLGDWEQSRPDEGDSAICPPVPLHGRVAAFSRGWALTSLGLILLILGLPVLAFTTPPGQRLVERLIEAPLLARLEASAPYPFTLDVDDLQTRVGGSSIQVELIGARLTAPQASLELNEVTVRLRYVDVLRRNLLPGQIEVETARLTLHDQPAIQPSAQPAQSAPVQSGGGFNNPLVSSIEDMTALEPLNPAAAGQDSTPDMVSSTLLDGMLDGLDILDQWLSDIAVGGTWQSLRTIEVDRLEIIAMANASLPLLRTPVAFEVSIEREGPRAVIGRIQSLGRQQPIRMVVRHAETDPPDGPAVLAQTAGVALEDGHPFSHVLLYGVKVSDLTDVFANAGPVQFDSELAGEIILTRNQQDKQLEQVVALFESGSGYLVASQTEATILEFASVPMIYTRQSGRIEIVSASVEFQQTGGVFSGALAPTVRDGRAGLLLTLDAPSYQFAVPGEPQLARDFERIVGQVKLEAFVDNSGRQIDLPLAFLSAGDSIVAFSGLVELGEAGPLVSLVGQSTPLGVSELGALWPLPLSPHARNWFLQNVAEASIGVSTLSFAGRLSAIEMRGGRAFLPDGMLDMQVPYTNLVMRTVGDLPPVYGLDGTIAITGRTLTMTGTGGVARLSGGDTIAVSSARFHIPDHALVDPPASLELQMEGPASGFATMALMDPISLENAPPFAPESLSGRASVNTRIETALAPQIDRAAVRATLQATVTDFGSSDPIEGRRLSDGAFSMQVDETGLTITGQARLDGVLTDIDYSQGDGHGMQIAMQLNAEDRRRIGLDFGDYLTGTIGVDVGAQDADGVLSMAIDLTDAALSIPELGWSKPAGVAAQATFDVRERGDQRQIRNLVLAAGGLAVRGGLEFVDGDLRTADFQSVAIEGIGRFALALTRNGSSTSARLTGDRFVLTPDLLRGDREAVGALSLQLEVGELATREGSRLANVRLTYAQNGERITAFDLRAAHTDGTDLVGSLATEGSNNRLIISSGNAGTFLRFLGLYDRAQGGRATLVLDPQSVGGRVAGQLLLSDYQIVAEPAMANIFTSSQNAAGRDNSRVVLPGAVETAERVDIQVTNISFDRTPERLVISNAEGWGPSLGGNIEGVIDYAANRTQLRGTFIPFFSLNNFFSRIPILGQALGGRESEGLLGITFELVGTVDEPQLRINPMSILAPGVFRNIFEYQQNN